MEYKTNVFIFDSYEINENQKQISFKYIVKLNDKVIKFEEKIILPNPIPANISPVLLKKVLESLHLILGISYWKMYTPKKIIHSYLLSGEQTIFWNTVYQKGLGEFFYKNQIDFLKIPVLFEACRCIEFPESFLIKEKKTLLGIGGGKDSIVAFEKLKLENKNITGFILVNKGEDIKIKEDVLKIMNIPYLVVRREMDEKLLNPINLPQAYNGHVPITAIYFFISLLLAIVERFSKVVLPNGKSADFGNVEYFGVIVNHQWSKSKEFEDLFKTYVKLHITPGVEFGSILRQKSDTEIFKEFIQYPQYFPYFSSCNKNFSILKKQKTKWCGQCAKCAYTFVMLAAFLPKTVVIKIFGKDLLSDSSLIPLFKDLRGEGKTKPFDCVGTFEEVKEAFRLIKN